MNQVCDAVLHIDEVLNANQYRVLENHLRAQKGVISSGHNPSASHIIFIGYNPNKNSVINFIRMIERHGYHAERIN